MNFLLWIFLAWLGCVFYVIYQLTYPPICDSSQSFHCLFPLISNNSTLIVKLFIFPSPLPHPFSNHRNNANLVWSLNSSLFPKYSLSNVTIPIPVQVRKDNHFLHGYLRFSTSFYHGIDIDVPISLTKFQKEFDRDRRNLILETPSIRSTDETQHWKYGIHPLVIRFVTFQGVGLQSSLIPSISEELKIRRIRKDGRVVEVYEPLVMVDDLSLTTHHLLPMSRDPAHSDPSISLQIVPISPVYFGVRKLLSVSLDLISDLTRHTGQDDGRELDAFKYWLSDDRMFRYLLTQGVSALHMYLEIQAFRSDWKFFVGRQSFLGVSLSSQVFSLARALILFLYLHDQQASWLVLAPLLKDLLFGAYKVFRMRSRPRPDSSDPSLLREHEALVSALDSQATLHVSLVLYPAALGLALFSLLHMQHRSWWSWLVGSLADVVYIFGFAALIPQLYINHKLKSVAHLPVTAFLYKIFGTFVDDVFALIVQAPLKHRLMTLRDDLVLLGFLYQWWLYPSDKKRVNEFGFQFEKD